MDPMDLRHMTIQIPHTLQVGMVVLTCMPLILTTVGITTGVITTTMVSITRMHIHQLLLIIR